MKWENKRTSILLWYFDSGAFYKLDYKIKQLNESALKRQVETDWSKAETAPNRGARSRFTTLPSTVKSDTKSSCRNNREFTVINRDSK
jgi:hypothetical protein